MCATAVSQSRIAATADAPCRPLGGCSVRNDCGDHTDVHEASELHWCFQRQEQELQLELQRASTMKRHLYLLALTTLLGSVACDAYAQKGMGDDTGVARRAIKPKLITLHGTVRAIESSSCPKTTGRATVGTHLLLESSEERVFNIHLGPAAETTAIVRKVPVGSSVTVTGFRTEAMPEDHYVAKSVAIGDTTFSLRDDDLRPRWAGRQQWGRRGGGEWGGRPGRLQRGATPAASGDPDTRSRAGRIAAPHGGQGRQHRWSHGRQRREGWGERNGTTGGRGGGYGGGAGRGWRRGTGVTD